MKNDLISRSELLAKAIRVSEFDEGGWERTLRVVPMEEVKNAPAIDAEPIRHGRWIHCKGKSNIWYCSECGEKIIYNPTRGTYIMEKKPVHEVNKRCRNCGAKMGAEAKN